MKLSKIWTNNKMKSRRSVSIIAAAALMAGVFCGCSAETEAGFETVTFLAGKVDELGVPAILVIENSDQKIAQPITMKMRTQREALQHERNNLKITVLS